MKPKKYWAGFCNNKLHIDKFEKRPTLYVRKKDAMVYCRDVRLVQIIELPKIEWVCLWRKGVRIGKNDRRQ